MMISSKLKWVSKWPSFSTLNEKKKIRMHILLMYGGWFLMYGGWFTSLLNGMLHLVHVKELHFALKS